MYSSSDMDKLILRYLQSGGEMLQIRAGILGVGDVLLYDMSGKLKTFVITEVALNEWSSTHKLRGYHKMPKKYAAMLANV